MVSEAVNPNFTSHCYLCLFFLILLLLVVVLFLVFGCVVDLSGMTFLYALCLKMENGEQKWVSFFFSFFF